MGNQAGLPSAQPAVAMGYFTFTCVFFSLHLDNCIANAYNNGQFNKKEEFSWNMS